MVKYSPSGLSGYSEKYPSRRGYELRTRKNAARKKEIAAITIRSGSPVVRICLRICPKVELAQRRPPTPAGMHNPCLSV
jgi:hypothetical protein